MRKIDMMKIGTILKVTKDNENLYFRIVEINKEKNYIIGKICENKSGYPYLTSDKWKIDFETWGSNIEIVGWAPNTYLDRVMKKN